MNYAWPSAEIIFRPEIKAVDNPEEKLKEKEAWKYSFVNSIKLLFIFYN